jgi:hypothetical protein
MNQLIIAYRAILAVSLAGVFLGGGSAAALAQTASSQTAPQRAYSDGFKLQPRPSEGENRGSTDPAQVESLLDSLAKGSGSSQPESVPTDIYGRPLGNNPGLNPPGLKTKPKS